MWLFAWFKSLYALRHQFARCTTACHTQVTDSIYAQKLAKWAKLASLLHLVYRKLYVGWQMLKDAAKKTSACFTRHSALRGMQPAVLAQIARAGLRYEKISNIIPNDPFSTLLTLAHNSWEAGQTNPKAGIIQYHGTNFRTFQSKKKCPNNAHAPKYCQPLTSMTMWLAVNKAITQRPGKT